MPHVWICLIQLPNKHNSAINAIFSRNLQMYIANVYLQVLLQMYIANIYIYIAN